MIIIIRVMSEGMSVDINRVITSIVMGVGVVDLLLVSVVGVEKTFSPRCGCRRGVNEIG